MAGGEHGRVAAWYEGKQRILNAHPIPPRFTRARQPIPVRARIEWERDGVELVDTHANAWTHSLVLVDVHGRGRYHLASVWVGVEDVVRR